MFDKLNVFYEEDIPYIEIKGTENMQLKERVRLHIALLRLLRQGVELEKAVDEVMTSQ